MPRGEWPFDEHVITNQRNELTVGNLGTLAILVSAKLWQEHKAVGGFAGVVLLVWLGAVYYHANIVTSPQQPQPTPQEGKSIIGSSGGGTDISGLLAPNDQNPLLKTPNYSSCVGISDLPAGKHTAWTAVTTLMAIFGKSFDPNSSETVQFVDNHKGGQNRLVTATTIALLLHMNTIVHEGDYICPPDWTGVAPLHQPTRADKHNSLGLKGILYSQDRATYFNRSSHRGV